MGMLKIGKSCSVCKEWQEHCYWSHMADDCKHFLTYMVGDFTESMIVPTRFSNNFNGHISEEVNLKPPSGRTWSIGVANSDTGELVLRSGWKEFVDANGVQENDCLLFRYSGVSSFYVLIFDPSGCEKASPHFVENHGFGREEKSAGAEEGGRDGDKNGHHQHQLEMTPHKNSSRCRSIPRAYSASLTCIRPLILVHTCMNVLAEQDHREEKKEVDHEDEDEDEDEDGEDRYYFCRHGGRVTEYNLSDGDKEEISRVPVPVEPGNPVLVKVIHASHLLSSRYSTVGVSPEFAGRYLGPAVAREVVMERGGGGGDQWHVRFVRRESSRGFHGTGWRRFARDNGLLAHDVCLFELRLVGGAGAGDRLRRRPRPTMKVHVLRRRPPAKAEEDGEAEWRDNLRGGEVRLRRVAKLDGVGVQLAMDTLAWPARTAVFARSGKNTATGAIWPITTVPARFANNFNGHISEEVNLRSPSGKTWSIGVANSDAGELVLQSGWKEFVDGNGIEEGDCLLFRYSGVSSFEVLIFDPSGCEKASPHFVGSHGFGGAENSAGAERGGGNGRRTPPIVDGDNGHRHHLEMTLHRNSGRSIPRACKRSLFSDETERGGREAKENEDEDEEEEEDVVAATEGGRYGEYYFSRHGRVAEYNLREEDREEISRVPVPVEPGNPVFVQVIHSSHVRSSKYCIVGVSPEFAGKYLGAVEREVVLERESRGGEWHVLFVHRRNTRGFYGGGWRQFAGDNRLVAHDVCLFELMMVDAAAGRNRRRPTMTVHVLRRVRGRFVLLR
uniref:TF-B3 domain-containing protein n=1 Tax=Oryza meridionalis TaxID=40149 RepID=A0A0E0D3S4_9ORYZ